MGSGEERVENAEYDSEGEDSPQFLRIRREATDDDEGDEESEMDFEFARRLRIDYGDESDGQKGLPEYYDEEPYIDELEELAGEVSDDFGGDECPGYYAEGDDEEEDVAKKLREETEKTAVSVPKSGEYYMHDDRFGARRGRRQRQNLDYIQEPKEEPNWKHDKFEEMILQETHKAEFDASKVQSTSTNFCPSPNHGEKARSSVLHEGNSSRKVRGRGPVRYTARMRSRYIMEPQIKRTSTTHSATVFSEKNKQPGWNSGMNTSRDTGIAFSHCLNADPISCRYGFMDLLCRTVQSNEELARDGSINFPRREQLSAFIRQKGQKFDASTAFMPAMQFGGLQSGGLCDPALASDLIGYTDPSQVSFENSMIRWSPVPLSHTRVVGGTLSSCVTYNGGSYANSSGLPSTDATRYPVIWDNAGSVGATHSYAPAGPDSGSYANSIAPSSTCFFSGQSSKSATRYDHVPSMKTDDAEINDQADSEHMTKKINSRRYSNMKLQDYDW